MRITLDTNVLPDAEVERVASSAGHDLRVTTVASREVEGTSFVASLPTADPVLETGVWGESTWGGFVWATGSSPLEGILQVLSNGSFPRRREQLTQGEHHQLRDAMALEAHLRAGRDIFLSRDAKAFINNGRREALADRFGVRVLLPEEYVARYR